MSQTLAVQPPVTPTAVKAAGAVDTTQAADSGQSFSDTLAGQLAGGEPTPGSTGAEVAGGTKVSPTPTAESVAAPGNTLPASLPPEVLAAVALLPGRAATESTPLSDAAMPADALAATDASTDLLAAGSGAIPAAALAAHPVPESPAMDSRAFSSSVTPKVTGTLKPAAANASETSALDSAESVLDPFATLRPAAEDADRALPEIGSRLAAAPIPSAAQTASTLTIPAALSGSAQMAAETTFASSAPAPAGSSVSVPFGQPAWGQAFGSQVVWAVGQNIPSAELHLSPPDLGPVSVRIRMDQDQASISFTSPHAAVREAIEAALPRLRDMLGAQGIVLADANVAQHGHSQQAHQQGSGHAAGRAGRDRGVESESEPLVALRIPAAGVLDLYA